MPSDARILPGASAARGKSARTGHAGELNRRTPTAGPMEDLRRADDSRSDLGQCERSAESSSRFYPFPRVRVRPGSAAPGRSITFFDPAVPSQRDELASWSIERAQKRCTGRHLPAAAERLNAALATKKYRRSGGRDDGGERAQRGPEPIRLAPELRRNKPSRWRRGPGMKDRTDDVRDMITTASPAWETMRVWRGLVTAL